MIGIPPVLARGELEILGLLPNSSNYTFLARATLGDQQELAVYKPRRGETPLWDFPDGTLCHREVAAYLVAGALGWPDVPPTLLRDGPEGVGSVQRFVHADVAHHYFTLADRPELSGAFRRIALFDIVANNADRKAGACLLDAEGRVWAIDHGVCFSDDDKLRTVIWEFVGEPIEQALVEDLRRVCVDVASGPLRGELAGLLASEELDALVARGRRVIDAGVFPEPGEHRPFPWPPV